MKSPYISKVIIQNYRNFRHCEANLSHKGVIIGENNVGKTNFIRSLQLILDPTLSEENRCLTEEDFFDGLENPVENGLEIKIQVYISNYEDNGNIMAQLNDATVNDGGEKKLLITYKYYPLQNKDGKNEYNYIIFKGENEDNKFTYEDRKYLNIKVIKAIRDVESEINNSRTSPLNKLIKSYSIEKSELEEIAQKLSDNGADVLELDEIVDLGKNINNSFSNILGIENNFNVSLKTMNIDPNKLLNSMKVMMAKRDTTDVSLGLNNLLYISLMLLLIKDKTVPSFMREQKYKGLLELENSDIIEKCYTVNSNGNYFISKNLDEDEMNKLYKFMDENEPTDGGATILIIEEPEAHLHPTYQRLIYKDVIRNNESSVLLTTHSTHITSITDIESIIHMHKNNNGETKINTTSNLELEESDLLDLQRYIDIKRGEIYLGRGVILVEGIAEEYLIPKFVELMDKSLDEKGIIVCDINCTNFKPYVKLLMKLDIPFVVITDRDFYIVETNDKGEEKRKFHVMDNQETAGLECGYLGLERISNLVNELQLYNGSIPEDITEQDKLFNQLGFYIGSNTLEVDMMNACKDDEDAKNIICELFNELTDGGQKQKDNFKKQLDEGEYWKCLNKIEANGIGKGRFSQTLASRVIKSHIPKYIEEAVNYIFEKVREY